MIPRPVVIIILSVVLWSACSPSICLGEPSGNNSDRAPVDENPHPTWETQKQARTFQLGIPAPRGQITDRNGYPFAQNRLS